MDRRQGQLLVVDSDRAACDALVEALGSDYQLRFAATGGRALDVVFGPQPPDLVLIEADLPDIDGYEVCMRIKASETTRDLPVIFVSRLTDAEAEACGFEAGAVDYVAKPIHPQTLRVRVRNHLELKRAKDLLRHMAITDPLTGLANRRHFVSALEAEWRRALRATMPLALLIFDVDHFKRYNDHYGHLAGDDCLTQVALAAASVLCRAGDAVARYGGEEFVALLPNTDESGATRASQRVLEAVRRLAIPHEASDVADTVTVSIGYTSLVPLPDLPSNLIIARADTALYAAKAAGRNQAVAWREDMQRK